MKLAKNVPSVWPGYVAAIASLVLSLLLLLAILVFALTQVGNLVSNYREEILKAVLLAESLRPIEVFNIVAPAAAEITKKKVAPIEKPVISAEKSYHQVTLIFSAGLADIPDTYKSRIEKAIQETPSSGDSNWRIWSTAFANDPLMERAAFQLMLAARRTLVAQGISEKRIELQLSKAEVAPANYLLGEIVVHIAPVPSKPVGGQ